MNNNGPEFFQTVMGQRFFEGTMPKIARTLERIADALEKRNDLESRLSEMDAEKMELLRRQNDANDQALALRQREIDLYESQSQCDCPECVARREAESLAKG